MLKLSALLSTNRGVKPLSTIALSVPGGLVQASQQSLGAGLSVARHLTSGGHAALGQAVNVTTTNAFLHGMQVGCLVAAGVALAGGIAAAALLPARPAAPSSVVSTPADASAAPAPADALVTPAPADASAALAPGQYSRGTHRPGSPDGSAR